MIMRNSLSRRVSLCACLALPFLALPAVAEDKEPAAFEANCKACHALSDSPVGPSLIEIAKLYPRKRAKEFIQWCINPGKKRAEMPQMPAMAHVSEAELKEIHEYVLSVTKGKTLRMKPKKDLFKDSPSAVQRPRVTRTFVPKSGPASMVIALPTVEKHNLIWDTDLCRLRYVSLGEIDNFPYLRSNGNSLADVGEICYTEEALFAGDAEREFKGYAMTKEGFPILHYSIGKTTIKEAVMVKKNVIIRTITASPALPRSLDLKSSKKVLPV